MSRGQICPVCANQRRAAIEACLTAGEPGITELSRQHGVTRMSLYTHRDKHMPGDIKAALAQREEHEALVRGGTILEQMTALAAEARSVLREAKQTKDLRLVMQAIERTSTILERQAKLEGLIGDGGTTNVSITVNDFRTLQVNLVAALADFPAAKQAVLRVLGSPDLQPESDQ